MTTSPRYFALSDQGTGLGAVEVTTDEEKAEWQSRGYGIFWVVNSFEGRHRRAENLSRINYWFVDLDGGDKGRQLRVLQEAALVPSMVVESANGFHAYWRVQGEADPANWKRVVRWGLVPALNADPRATDVLRLLRAPGWNHLKDPERPYLVRVVWECKYRYTETAMMQAFADQSKPARELPPRTLDPSTPFWFRVSALDGREAIRRVSGHWLCNGERFRLEEAANGTAKIIREPDGYGTGCFVWPDGRLGNVEGGSSIAAWCKWYGHTWGEVARGLKELFPELEDGFQEESAGGQETQDMESVP